jgi:hypothetical protein
VAVLGFIASQFTIELIAHIVDCGSLRRIRAIPSSSAVKGYLDGTRAAGLCTRTPRA